MMSRRQNYCVRFYLIISCYLFLIFPFFGFSQCDILLVNDQDFSPINQVHCFVGDEVLVSDEKGSIRVGSTTDKFSITTSHIGYETFASEATCGDTIYLTPTEYLIPTVTIGEELSSSQRKKLIQVIKRTCRNLAVFKGRGVAENAVFYNNSLSEYKNFLLNVDMTKDGIAGSQCINAYTHVRPDTIRYFKNPHAIFNEISLGVKRQDKNSWLYDFLFNSDKWTLNYHYKMDGVMHASFQLGKHEIIFEYDDVAVRSIAWVNPVKLLPKIELDNRRTNEKYATVRIDFDKHDGKRYYIASANGVIDIERGRHMTHFAASFENGDSYRDPTITLLDDSSNPFIRYLLLDVGHTLVASDEMRLANKDQVVGFINDVPRVDISTMLRQFDVFEIGDSLALADIPSWGEPFYIKRTSYLYMADYYNLVPPMAFYLVLFENHHTQLVDGRYVIDPSNCHFLQFHDSDYNDEWFAKQLKQMLTLNNVLKTQFDNNKLLGTTINKISDGDWRQINDALNHQTEDFLNARLLVSQRGLERGVLDYRRLSTYR